MKRCNDFKQIGRGSITGSVAIVPTTVAGCQFKSRTMALHADNIYSKLTSAQNSLKQTRASRASQVKKPSARAFKVRTQAVAERAAASV